MSGYFNLSRLAQRISQSFGGRSESSRSRNKPAFDNTKHRALALLDGTRSECSSSISCQKPSSYEPRAYHNPGRAPEQARLSYNVHALMRPGFGVLNFLF